ncbi:MAG: hypothetical protein ACI8S6_000501 [Myxococcota bacterium]
MILPLILLCLASVGLAQDDDFDFEPFIELKPEELPVTLKVPRDEIGSVQWMWSIMPEPNIDLLMTRYEQPPVSVGFGWMEGFQPDLDRLDPGYFDRLLYLDDETWSYDEERPVRIEEHPILGKVAVTDFGAVFDGKKPEMPPPDDDATPEEVTAMEEAFAAIEDPPPIALDMRLMYFAVQGGAAYVLSQAPGVERPDEEIVGLPEEEKIDLPAITEEVLAMVEIRSEPVAAEELPTGRVELEAGYALTLPENWRALTKKEMNLFSPERVGDGPYEGRRAARLFVEPSTLKPQQFTCQVYDTAGRPIEIVDPAKSAVHGDNYRTHARIMLKGGSFKISSGGVEEVIKVFHPSDLPPVTVAENAQGTLELVELADREAYRWTVEATQGEETAVMVHAFYATWDNIGLNCFAIEGEEDEGLGDIFRATMDSIEILEPDEHPARLSFMSQYRRWWPYAHPALQLYWIVIPLFFLALIPMLRDWWQTR